MVYLKQVYLEAMLRIMQIIDILVKLEFKKGMYQNFCELQKELEKIFNRKVDLIEKETFDNKFRSDNVREYKKR